MSTLTADTPHTLTIPGELFARLARKAAAKGQDPDQFALSALDAMFAPSSAASLGNEQTWRGKLREGEAIAREAFLASGMTDDELSEVIEAEVKAHRAERAER